MRSVALLAALCAAAVTASAAVAAPASDQVRANGSVSNGDGTFDNFAVYAKSGPSGEDPRGSVFVDAFFISRTTGATLGNGTVRGDVSEGCVVVVGNRSAVLGKLREPVTLAGPGLVEYVGVVSEDNGDSPDAVDRAEVYFIRESARAAFCTTGLFLSFATRPVVEGYVEILDS
jgi:hypothetical protein